MIFPVGLSMIAITGSQLLTSNFFYGSLPLLFQEGAIKAPGVVQNALRLCGSSLAGNFAGSFLVAWACAKTVFYENNTPHVAWLQSLTEYKCNLGAPTAFVKAIGANFLVNVAVSLAASAKTPAGKMASLWGPICIFVVLGLEHSVANMFILPLGILKGARVTWEELWLNNLSPVIVGNLVGAVFLAVLQRPSAIVVSSLRTLR